MANFELLLFHLHFQKDKQDIRHYIKTCPLLGLNAIQIHDELTTAYGHGYVSYPMVTFWCGDFVLPYTLFIHLKM